ncbi:hypothetical protein EV121DRAFT_266652 [Schizophyllum commune]
MKLGAKAAGVQIHPRKYEFFAVCREAHLPLQPRPPPFPSERRLLQELELNGNTRGDPTGAITTASYTFTSDNDSNLLAWPSDGQQSELPPQTLPNAARNFRYVSLTSMNVELASTDNELSSIGGDRVDDDRHAGTVGDWLKDGESGDCDSEIYECGKGKKMIDRKRRTGTYARKKIHLPFKDYRCAPLSLARDIDTSTSKDHSIDIAAQQDPASETERRTGRRQRAQ